MTRQPTVVIAGAGPIGLTAALLLGSKDIRVTVLETDDKISDALRASTWHPPTLDMLAPYGITDRMLAAGLLCPSWQIRMHPSGDRAVFDLSILEGETDHPYRLQYEQSKYGHLVLDAVGALPSVTI
ncbi:MAG: FAD-dependent monooxygenase, partial [Hyphomicrobiales bacterium]